MESKGRATANMFEGTVYTGAPVRTLVRGHTVMHDGKLTGKADDGAFTAIPM
jgi:dihydroorotase-like cyclic amidohydrolase